MTRLLGAALVIGVLAEPGLALAQKAQPSADEIKRAAAAFDNGKRAYRNDQWIEAAELFESADQAAPSAAALELAIRSRDKADQPARAATLAALALARHADNDKLVKLAKDVIADARKDLFELRVACNEPCDLVVDSKLVHGQPASERTLYLEPGAHRVTAGWSDKRSKSESVKADKGQAGELSFEAPALDETDERPVATPPASPPPPERPREQATVSTDSGGGLPPIVFLIGTGLTVAAGAATAWSGIDTQNNPGADRVREECAGQGESCELYQQGLDKQRRTNILAAVTGGLGLATIAIGVFFTDWGGDEKPTAEQRAPKRASIEPFVGLGGGATIGAQGRF